MPTQTNTPFASAISAGLPAGVATAAAMWTLWWIGHLPGLAIPAAALIVLLVTANALSIILWARWAGRALALHAGVTAGVTAGLLNLLLLGSRVVVQPASVDELASSGASLRPDAAVIVVGFLGVSAAIGALCGWVGSRWAREQSPDQASCLAALATSALATFIPLIVVGGSVTSTESGMAVPDAWTTYDNLVFLFPLSLMAGEWGEPKVFFEHTHRLFGSLVGLVSLLVAGWTWWMNRPGTLRPGPARFVAIGVFILVVVQGTLGALRVGENSPPIAAVHGVFGQLVFAAAVVLAAMLSRTARSPDDDRVESAAVARRASGFALAALICVLLQLSLGAVSRHLGAMHATWTHAGFGFIVAGVVSTTGALLKSAPGPSPAARTLRRIGALLVGLVGVQFLLGFVVLWQVTQPEAARPILTADDLSAAPAVDVFEAVVATVHQTLGAGILALVTLAVFWTRQLRILAPRTTAATAATTAKA